MSRSWSLAGLAGLGCWQPVAACGGIWRRSPAPVETFARSWLAGLLAGCWPGWLASDVWQPVAACGGIWCRSPAPLETFARSWLAG